MFKWTLRTLLACCTALPLTAVAQPRNDIEEEAEAKPRVELEVTLPPLPKAANLLAFEGSATNNNRFFIDADSIFVGADGIVRYTLVIKSPSGAENVSHEGMRCDTRDQKYYAFGRNNGTWSPARAGEWRRIVYKDVNRHHGELYADYFCPNGRPISSAAEAIRRFKYGVPRADGSRR